MKLRRIAVLALAMLLQTAVVSARAEGKKRAAGSAKNSKNENRGTERDNDKSSFASSNTQERNGSFPTGKSSAVGTHASSKQMDSSHSPLSFKIGGADFTPFGFLDLTTVYRSTDVGSGIGTSFGSIPFNGASPAGQLSEIRFSAQNSRLGLRVDANPNSGLRLTGYIEADFLGNAPSTLEVTSHSDTLRLRLYWVDIHYGKWEILGGQSWSMMTPNRKGISPLPSDVFYTQDMDTNYQVGLVWLRTPGARVVFHPSEDWALGFALEDPEQFTGGLVTFPAGFNTSQVDDSGGKREDAECRA